MTSVSFIVSRLAGRLVHPGVLDEALSSGLFLVRALESDPWKTFACELAVELRRLGAIVICIDLLGSSTAPSETLRRTLHAELFALNAELPSPRKHDHDAAAGFTFASKIKESIARSGRDLILILDHASLLAADAERHTLMALKAARDAVNLDPQLAGRFLLVAIDADSASVRKLATDPDQAFYGACIEVLSSPGSSSENASPNS